MRMQLNQMRRKFPWVTILWFSNAVLYFLGKECPALRQLHHRKSLDMEVALPVVATSGGGIPSRASSYVTSNQSNSATVQEGDSYSFTFSLRATGLQFGVEGLPSGLTYGSSTSPTISGTPDAAGSYSIEITGYRWSG